MVSFRVSVATRPIYPCSERFPCLKYPEKLMRRIVVYGDEMSTCQNVYGDIMSVPK